MTKFVSAALIYLGASLLGKASDDIIPTPETVQAIYIWVALVGLVAIFLGVQSYARKIGGLTFLRLGRVQMSFCVTKV